MAPRVSRLGHGEGCPGVNLEEELTHCAAPSLRESQFCLAPVGHFLVVLELATVTMTETSLSFAGALPPAHPNVTLVSS